MPPNTVELERLREAHNQQYPKAQIGQIADEIAAAEHLAFGQFLWDGTGKPIASEYRRVIETPPPEGAFY